MKALIPLSGFTFLFTLFVVSAEAAPAGCEEVRAAIDIGSGSTKMVVARVDTCTQSVLEILAPPPGDPLSRQVTYRRETVERDGSKEFTPQVIEQGISTLVDFKAIAHEMGATRISAVATEAFRNLSPQNAAGVIARIRDSVGIPVRILSQSEEARIGFLAASVKANVPRENLLVWDIGGGSMQISYWDDASKQVVPAYRGRFANEAMYQYALQLRGGKAGSNNPTPNPIHPDLARQAVDHAAGIAIGTVPSRLFAHIAKTAPTVVGIGGVHFYSNCEVMMRFSKSGCEYGESELTDQIVSHAHMTDEELVEKGLSVALEYAPHRITGGAMTAGFMQALGINQVRSVKADMGDGILVDPEFW